MSRPPAKAAFLLVASAMVWFLPYCFPVAPTMAVSYMVGFNNQAAVVVFVVLTAVFAVITRGVLAERVSEHDQRLLRADLLLGLLAALAGCFFRHHRMQAPGAESTYAINRLQMLASGIRPYTGFEFIYGPLHLYLPLAIAKLFRTSMVNGYYAWWYAQWLLGTGMVWLMVELLPFRLSRRRLMFALILLSELASIRTEGTAYTPLRLAGAAFCVLAVQAVWARTRSTAWLLTACVLAVLFGFGVSPEQGLALGFGLLAWLCLWAWRGRARGPGLAAGGLALCLVPILLGCEMMGIFRGLSEFAGGAFSWPLLPSVPVAAVLLAYVAAACSAVRAWLARDLSSATIPMLLCGFALLPAAFGRSDLGHLQIASSAFFLGVATIEQSPALRRFWSPVAILFLVLPFYEHLGKEKLKMVLHRTTPVVVDERTLLNDLPAGTRTIVLRAPCPVMYAAPTIWPAYHEQPGQECLDTGFFAGTLDVLTPDTMQRKMAELTALPRKPLLMRAIPLADQFIAQDTIVDAARQLQFGFYRPPLRHAPVTYEPLIEAIEANYTPGPVTEGGLQVWQPKPLAGGTAAEARLSTFRAKPDAR